MNFKFFPQTKEEIEHMLKQAGMNSLDDLYADVPEQIRFRGEYDLPEPMSETEIRSLFEKLGEKNRRLTVFAGAGCYDHYTPAVVPNIIRAQSSSQATLRTRLRFRRVHSTISSNTRA